MEPKKRLIPIVLSNHKEFLAEVAMIGGEEDAASRLLSFDGAIDAIEGIANGLNQVLGRVKPHKAKVEFAIQLSAKEGRLSALLVSGEGSASIKISLEWGSDRSTQ